MKKQRKHGYLLTILIGVALLIFPMGTCAAGRTNTEIRKLLSPYRAWVKEYLGGRLVIDCPITDLSEEEILCYLWDIVDSLQGELGSDYTEITVQFSFSDTKNDSFDEFSDEAFAFKRRLNYLWTNWSSYDYLDLSASTSGALFTEEYTISIRLELNGTDGSGSRGNYNTKLAQIIRDGKRETNGDQKKLVEYFCRWLEKNVDYDSSLWNNSAYMAVMEGRAVCGGFANALKDMCNAAGIHALVLTSDKLNHAWNQVYLDGVWYTVDLLGVVHPKDGRILGEYLFTNPNAECDYPDFLAKIKKQIIYPKPFMIPDGTLELKGKASLKSRIGCLTDEAAVTYRSSNPSKIRVDKNGNMTPINKGTATLTAKVRQNGRTYTLKQKVRSLTISQEALPKKGKILEYRVGKYRVTKAAKVNGTGITAGTVEFAGVTSKAGFSLEIPEKIKVDGAEYKVTAVGQNALKNSKKIKKLVLGKNISVIKKGAFARTQSLRNIRIKSPKMTAGSIARGAFSGTYKKLQITIPKEKKSLYKSWLYKAGVSRSAKFILK